jgi:hypothetical protein
MSDNKAIQATAGTPAPEKKAEKVELKVNTSHDISSQIEILRNVEVSGPSFRTFTLSGFKNTKGLEGISNDALAVMICACFRQMALNGDVKETSRLTKLVSEYAKNVQGEVETERKLDSYLIVAEDLGIKRNKDETAGDFIARVLQAASAKK